MLFVVIQLILCVLFFLALGIMIKRRRFKLLWTLFTTAIMTTQLASVIIGGDFIDLKFYAHFKKDIITGVGGFFGLESFILTVFFLVFVPTFYMAINKGDAMKLASKKTLLALVFLTVAGMSIKGGVLRNLWDISEVHLAEEKLFEDALTDIGFEEIVAKNLIRGKKGKNIILIAMESVEAGFLQDEFNKVTPNMRRMKEEMGYFPMTQHDGGDYTIAALYSYLTGVPMFFKHHGNDVFFDTKSFKLPSIIDVLSRAGYHCEYLLGNAEFAGTKDMLELMGFDVKSEKQYPAYKTDHWGLHDKDLFEITSMRLDTLLEDKEPFAFFLSTISTHGPDGVFDGRMAKVIPEQKSQLELMAAALDKHIGDLVLKLEEYDKLDDTAIFIVPDHMLYYLGPRVINDFKEPRGLFVITNAETDKFDPDETILQMDLPKLILDGAGVRHNMKFLTDYIEGNKLDWLELNRKALLQLNESALIRDSIHSEEIVKQKPGIEPEEGKLSIIANAWYEDNYGNASWVYLNKEVLEVSRGMNLLVYQDSSYLLENFDTWDNPEEIERLLSRIKKLTDSKSCFYAFVHDSAGDIFRDYQLAFHEIGVPELGKLKNRKAYMAFSNLGFTSEYVHHEKIELTRPYVPRSSNRSMDIMIDQSDDRDRFIAHAGGEIDGHTYTNCLEAMDLAYEKGFRLFELDIIKTSDGHYVASHDWEKWRYLTKYAGNIPVNLETFRKYKKHGKYTSMDMPMINDWFKSHPDAILVTDKINDPEAFVPQFIDRSRLMMELFSWDACRKAKSLGIKEVILSENVFKEIWEDEDKIPTLRKEGIEYLAISRRTIDSQPELYMSIKDAGIKVYAFHVTFDMLKDEAYMVREGMDRCYGFYADEWY